MNLIDEIVATIKETGTYEQALLTYGDKIKYSQAENLAKDLFSTLARLIEEEDPVFYHLLRVIHTSTPPWYAKQDVILQRMSRRNLLEAAISSENWTAANFLVEYAISSHWDSESWNPRPNHKVSPYQWGIAIQLFVKSCVTARILPAGISNANFAHLWVARLKHFKSVLDNGYVTLLDLIKYPSAFMLMVRLGADLAVYKNGINYTIQYCIWSSGLHKVDRKQLLKFLESIDPTLFDVPCGPNKVKLVYECLRASDLCILRGLSLHDHLDMNVKDAHERGICHYIHPKCIFQSFFTAEDRFNYAMAGFITGKTPVINKLVQLDDGVIFFNRYPELMKALECLIQKDKQVLSETLETTTDPVLVAYCMTQGHKPSKNSTFWDKLALTWDLTPKDEARTLRDLVLLFDTRDYQCHFNDLPDEIISLIVFEISFADMIKLFSTSTTMQRVFTRMTSPLLWKEIASKQFNGFKMKYLESQSITDWRSRVMNEMKWRNNWLHQRFIERTIFTDLNRGLCLAADDNWLVFTNDLQVHCWNCHTFESYSMFISQVTLGNVVIVESSPNDLTIAINGYSWGPESESVIVVAHPLSNRVLKQIKPCVSTRGVPFFFKYQSKLCYVAPDLLEVDIAAGVTRVLKQIGTDFIRLVAVNFNEDALLLVLTSWNRPMVMLDADMNFVDVPHVPALSTVIQEVFLQSGSAFTTCADRLEFGRWFGHCGSETVYNSLIDTHNDRLLVKQRSVGISMLLHPNLKSWYTAWIETSQKFVAMNSRYLFLYDQKSGCVSCRDFNWTN